MNVESAAADAARSASGLRETLDAMRAAHARDPLPDAATRIARLDALEALMRENRNAIVAAIDADFGRRPTEETDLLEIFPSLAGLRHARRHVRRWMRPRRHWANFWFLPARTEIVPLPRGVVGIIAPWNYPLYLTVGPLVDALAAGNRAMVKASEFTPRFSALFADLVSRSFARNEIAVITGDAEVGRAFAALPFDHLLFTGSTAVGRHVMAAAAPNLTPVTLELGGKSPALVGPGARLEHAAERIVLGKLLNAGQTCIAPDYALVPRTQVSAFIDAARAVAAKLYPALPANPHYASIVSDRHFARLATLRDEAAALGAKVHALASSGDDAAARVLAPVMLTDVDERMQVMQEEIFGPLLPIVAYDTIDGAIACIASHPHPLALYVFDDDRATLERVQRATLAGGVTLNDTILHIAQHNLPFGGVGASGIGAYHGEAGFRTFSHMKPVMRQARINAVSLLNPPYGRTFRALVELLLR